MRKLLDWMFSEEILPCMILIIIVLFIILNWH